ncbi:katanin p60 ATPase-containing subunit A1-like [Impatiens glandulifera]|uniref:katanin p60 ATPase-containing subunit A1-like n=1 Tax=Impatiens glandulifera TaxID=253017 RepID=UPI001FB077E3|nr:katanin p60 ATPase-containing subunit A1-like [Impatiens glandulifera]
MTNPPRRFNESVHLKIDDLRDILIQLRQQLEDITVEIETYATIEPLNPKIMRQERERVSKTFMDGWKAAERSIQNKSHASTSNSRTKYSSKEPISPKQSQQSSQARSATTAPPCRKFDGLGMSLSKALRNLLQKNLIQTLTSELGREIQDLIDAKIIPKLRRMKADIVYKIKEEVEKQLDAGYLEVIDYQEWIANVVLVAKKDGKIRALATETGTSFINITASTLLSEWFGESVKILKILLAKTVHGGSRKTTWLKFSWLVFTNDEASNMNELRKWNEKYGQGGSRKTSSFGFANQSELLASS